MGHIPEFSSVRRSVSNGARIVTIGLPVFEKFGGKRFPFRPPSGGTANCRRGKLDRRVKLDSKFLHVKFFRSSIFGGRDIRDQTKLEFPGPEYENPIRVPTPVKGDRKHYRQSRIINSSTLGVIRVVAGRVPGAAKAVERAKNRRRVQCFRGEGYGAECRGA